MVARISVGKNLYGALAYNQNKVDEGGAKVLSAHLLRYPEDGRFRPDESVRQFLEWMPNHYRTEKPVIHISLNPHPDDVLTDGQLAEIGREYMQRLGYGNQPYLVFKHEDIGRHHIHIVSLRVDSEGRKVSDKFEYRRSKEITELLEQKYGLHPAEGRKKGEEWQLKPVDVAKGDIKRQIACTLKPLLELYSFRTMGELRALLSLYNIGVEEVKGEIGGRTYHGILYTALDGNGETVATPIKSSRLGRTAGAQQLDRKMRESAARIKSDPCRERLTSGQGVFGEHAGQMLSGAAARSPAATSAVRSVRCGFRKRGENSGRVAFRHGAGAELCPPASQATEARQEETPSALRPSGLNPYYIIIKKITF